MFTSPITSVVAALSALLLSSSLPAEELPVARYHFSVLSPRTPLLLKGDRLFAGYKDALRIYDVSDRTAPRQAAQLKLTGLISDLALVDGNTIAAVNGALLIVVDVSNVASPRLVHQEVVGAPETHGPESLVVRDGHAYLACRKAGLKVYDLREPAAPKLVGELKLRGLAKSLALDGDRCFVATQTGVAVVDISAAPRLLTFYDTLRSAEEILLRPPHAMVFSKEYFAAIDFSELGAPRPIGECTTLDLFYFRYPQDVASWGDDVFSAQAEGGLYILDWREPAKPTVVAQFSCWEPKGSDFRYVIATGLALDAGRTAYIMGYDGRLSVLDIRHKRGKFEIYPLARTELPKKK